MTEPRTVSGKALLKLVAVLIVAIEDEAAEAGKASIVVRADTTDYEPTDREQDA
jgi:hypothetical protein